MPRAGPGVAENYADTTRRTLAQRLDQHRCGIICGKLNSFVTTLERRKCRGPCARVDAIRRVALCLRAAQGRETRDTPRDAAHGREYVTAGSSRWRRCLSATLKTAMQHRPYKSKQRLGQILAAFAEKRLRSRDSIRLFPDLRHLWRRGACASARGIAQAITHRSASQSGIYGSMACPTRAERVDHVGSELQQSPLPMVLSDRAATKRVSVSHRARISATSLKIPRRCCVTWREFGESAGR